MIKYQEAEKVLYKSVKHFDICQECILDFVSNYLKSSNRSTSAYIEIDSGFSYPNVERQEKE